MLKIWHIYGAADSTLELDPAELSGDWKTDVASAYVLQFVAGRVAKVGTDGYIALALPTDIVEGPIVNDASGYTMENTPALASGKVTILAGGCLVETDQVVDSDLAPGDVLYPAPAGLSKANAGKLTKTNTGGSSVPCAIVRRGNSSSDLTTLVRFFGK